MRSFQHTEKRTWALVDENGHVLGTLVQPHWFKWHMELVVPEGVLTITRSGTWSRNQTVSRGEAPIADITFSWRGEMGVTFRNSQLEGILVKRTGMFSRTYIVSDLKGVERARISTRMNWKLFQYGPILQQEAGEPLSPLHLLLAVHTIFETYRRASAAAA